MPDFEGPLIPETFEGTAVSQTGYIEFIIKEYSGTLGTGTTVLTAGHDFFVAAQNY